MHDMHDFVAKIRAAHHAAKFLFVGTDFDHVPAQLRTNKYDSFSRSITEKFSADIFYPSTQNDNDLATVEQVYQRLKREIPCLQTANNNSQFSVGLFSANNDEEDASQSCEEDIAESTRDLQASIGIDSVSDKEDDSDSVDGKIEQKYEPDEPIELAPYQM
jgi:hypothetical protein